MLSYGQNGGTSSFYFLQVPSSAQAAMLGGQVVASPHADISLAWENPSALKGIHHHELQTSYTFYLADASYTSAIFAHSFESAGNLGVGIRHMGYGDFTAANEFGDKLGTFTAQDNVLDIMWSRTLLDSSLYVGVGLSTILSNYEAYSSVAIASQFGVSYVSSDGLFSCGIAVRNFGRQVKPFVEGNYEELPFAVNLTLAKKLAHAPFLFSLSLHDLHNWELDFGTLQQNSTTEETNFGTEFAKHITLGVEFVPTSKFRVGVSYNHKRRQEMTFQQANGLAGFSWGIGFAVKRFRFQFANSFLTKAGASQMFSVNYLFSRR